MAKLSVDQALLKAKSHAKRGKIQEARELYEGVLQAFPKNKRAQQGLAALNKSNQPKATQSPPQETINKLIDLYNQGQLAALVEQAQALTRQYPNALIIWNILGSAAAQTGQIDEAINAFKRVTAIKPDYAEAHNNIGNILLDQGKLEEAIEAYKKALSLKPDLAEAHNNMGNALKNQGKLDEAIEAYKKALSLKPDYADVSHLLSSLTGKTTKSAPREYVENLFDKYAYKFDQSLVVKLSYDIPKVITQLALEKHGSGSLGSILDLGCGTGLTGEKIRPHCTNLEGIDLSRKMLEIAKSRNIYDNLDHVDIVEYLSNAELNFDYFIATDVFIYVGDLSEVFHLIKVRNKRPGKLIFSTEHTNENGFHLEKSGRYSHSKSYIEELCREFKFSISHFSETNLRKEKGSFLIGGLYFLDF